ncbi:MAG: hypothetical protein ACOX2U_02675 [Limisphaerales bacterium]|jgi:hypothetical protein|nr:hypothetical protein [Verrucomicrobiota bacterium]
MSIIASGRLWNRAGITGISVLLLLSLMLALLAAVHPSTHEWIHHAASDSGNHPACSHKAEAHNPPHSNSDSSDPLPAKAECFVLWIAQGLLNITPTFTALPQPIGFISLCAEPVYQLPAEAPEGLPFGRAPPSFNL